jgi:hypothetical protein
MSARFLTLTLLLAGGLIATLAACQTAQPAPAPAAQAAEPVGDKPDPSVLVGTITREQVEAAVPAWVQEQVQSQPDAAAAQGLMAVEPGAEITVFLGTWCGDSRREVNRLWRAIDEAGAAGGTVPFQIRYIGVDREKKEPAGPIGESGIRYVPTLIVRRGGQEVGRIVESSPHGVEADLLALLTGKATGTLSDSQPVSP